MYVTVRNTTLENLASSFSPYLGFHNRLSREKDSIIILCPYLGVVSIARPIENAHWTLDMWRIMHTKAETHNTNTFNTFFLLSEVFLMEDTLPTPTKTLTVSDPSLCENEPSAPGHKDFYKDTITFLHKAISQTWLHRFVNGTQPD